MLLYVLIYHLILQHLWKVGYYTYFLDTETEVGQIKVLLRSTSVNIHIYFWIVTKPILLTTLIFCLFQNEFTMKKESFYNLKNNSHISPRSWFLCWIFWNCNTHTHFSVYKIKQTWIFEGTILVVECKATSLDFLFGKDRKEKNTSFIY